EGEADEIAAQFWASLVFNNYHALRGFDPSRAGLARYMRCLGWQQVSIWMRRRPSDQSYLRPAALDRLPGPDGEVWLGNVVTEEFLSQLPPQLRDFCHYRMGDDTPFDPEKHPPAYVRVLAFRLRVAWDEFWSERSENSDPG